VPDVRSSVSAKTTRTWVALDVHKDSLAAGILSAEGGPPEVVQFENSERAVRRFLRRLGDPEALAVCYEAGPCGYDLYRLLTSVGVACDIIAPSLTPVRPGDRVKTDRRDAMKLVRLYRAGELSFVCPPTPACVDDDHLMLARRRSMPTMISSLPGRSPLLSWVYLLGGCQPTESKPRTA